MTYEEYIKRLNNVNNFKVWFSDKGEISFLLPIVKQKHNRNIDFTVQCEETFGKTFNKVYKTLCELLYKNWDYAYQSDNIANYIVESVGELATEHFNIVDAIKKEKEK